MTWRNLWQNPDEGRTSHSRVLALGAFIVVSWIIVRMEIRGATQYELVLGYLAVMVTGEVWKKTSRISSQRDIEIERTRQTTRVDSPD